jgi:hypothetical protein
MLVGGVECVHVPLHDHLDTLRLSAGIIGGWVAEDDILEEVVQHRAIHRGGGGLVRGHQGPEHGHPPALEGVCDARPCHQRVRVHDQKSAAVVKHQHPTALLPCADEMDDVTGRHRRSRPAAPQPAAPLAPLPPRIQQPQPHATTTAPPLRSHLQHQPAQALLARGAPARRPGSSPPPRSSPCPCPSRCRCRCRCRLLLWGWRRRQRRPLRPPPCRHDRRLSVRGRCCGAGGGRG